MEGVETSKLISMLRNDVEKIENAEVSERLKGTRQYKAFPFGGGGGGCYAATFRDSLALPSSDVKQRPEDGTTRMSSNVGNQLKT
jgi:hypothetical protein